MTIQLQQLKQYCDNTFSYIEDYTFNGLQVEGKNEIKKIVFSVSLSELLIDEAIRRGADCIFVHHGFFGKSFTKIQGPLKRKLQKLLVNDISLFAYHLPLDAHPILGHNAQLCNMAQLQIIKPLECGFICGNALNLTLSQIAEHINEHIPSKYAISQSGSGPSSQRTNLMRTSTNSAPKFRRRSSFAPVAQATTWIRPFASSATSSFWVSRRSIQSKQLRKSNLIQCSSVTGGANNPESGR
ncbi:Nif3-related_protein [Hexamita inflata]|uniref:Nif3-related_protein n=1 Tax=Hexamita inflata TaxID=28002 RepID=A0ABP1IIS8_9EUKA